MYMATWVEVAFYFILFIHLVIHLSLSLLEILLHWYHHHHINNIDMIYSLRP